MTNRELDQAARDAATLESTVRELVDLVRTLRSEIADAQKERETTRRKLQTFADDVNDAINQIEAADDAKDMLAVARKPRGKACPGVEERGSNGMRGTQPIGAWNPREDRVEWVRALRDQAVKAEWIPD